MKAYFCESIMSSGSDSLSTVNTVRKGMGKKSKTRQRNKPANLSESLEIKEYLHKLQALVPYTPKDRKVSKLEVISCCIDYIRDLRSCLGLPASCVGGNDSEINFTDFDMTESPLSLVMNASQVQSQEVVDSDFDLLHQDNVDVTLTVINKNSQDDETVKQTASPCRQPLGEKNPCSNSRVHQEITEKLTVGRDQ